MSPDAPAAPHGPLLSRGVRDSQRLARSSSEPVRRRATSSGCPRRPGCPRVPKRRRAPDPFGDSVRLPLVTMKRTLGACLAWSLVALCWIAPSSAADSGPLQLGFDDPGWEIEGEDSVVEQLDGELALRLKSGHATFRDLELLDGTIEFDLQVTELRSFAYIYFRMVSDDEHEEFYYRPHKSLLPDAVQYAPVYKGSGQWQLYH